MSSNSGAGGYGGQIPPELWKKLREAARERGLPESLARNPQALVMALADSPGSGDFSALLMEISRALEELDRVAEEKGRK